jgi:hypothetical protein
MTRNNVWRQSLSLTMDELLIGHGWYPVERHDEVCFRWLGPETQATVHLPTRRDYENRLNIVIHATASEAILAGLVLEADGVPLTIALGAGRAPTYMTAVLPQDSNKPKGQETVLTFRVPTTRPAAEVFPGSKDPRRISLALQAIQVFPLARPLFVAEKFAEPQPFDGLDYLRQHPGVRDAVVHGLYRSAYDYYTANRAQGTVYTLELHERFDECPGDLFDILADIARTEAAASEQRLRKEVDWLRSIVQRQGDTLRALKAERSHMDTALAASDKA